MWSVFATQHPNKTNVVNFGEIFCNFFHVNHLGTMSTIEAWYMAARIHFPWMCRKPGPTFSCRRILRKHATFVAQVSRGITNSKGLAQFLQFFG
jgi:hypothetical protein